MNENKVEEFQEHYKGVNAITLEDIKTYFKTNYPEISDAAVRKEVFKLKKKGTITVLRRGIYTIETKPFFRPQPDKFIKKIQKLYAGKYPEIPYCLWSTQWLHQFMNLQPFQFIYVFETEKELLEPAFFLFKENNINVFLKPDQNLAEKYMAESLDPLVVKLITTRSPIIQSDKMNIASIEKMLVDVFCDSEIFFFYQGNELRNIFNNAFRSFHINYSILLNYAERRKQKEKIVFYLKNQVKYANKELIS